ncbi:hypothetical protein UFOVP244_27 [uncultured Caudovirales phage]|uniref:Lipoprotein n=1 Tax=uncultured Caudovirales phage TaxID=2100421 RepID=A0A6J7WRV5_9CAUD|nr:hypothetical protein UFOVP244_27 [uncultured Caudovirales phage]
MSFKEKILAIVSLIVFFACVASPLAFAAASFPFANSLFVCLSSYGLFLFVLAPIFWKEQEENDFSKK